MSENTTTTTKAPRITKTMKFDAIAAALQGQDLPHNLTTQDLLDFVTAEKALLAKKNAKADGKLTKTQEENEGYKALILEYLAGLDEGKGASCTDLIKNVPELSEFNTSKISSLTRQLKDAGRIIRKEVKGKAIFYLA